MVLTEKNCNPQMFVNDSIKESVEYKSLSTDLEKDLVYHLSIIDLNNAVENKMYLNYSTEVASKKEALKKELIKSVYNIENVLSDIGLDIIYSANSKREYGKLIKYELKESIDAYKQIGVKKVDAIKDIEKNYYTKHLLKPSLPYEVFINLPFFKYKNQVKGVTSCMFGKDDLIDGILKYNLIQIISTINLKKLIYALKELNVNYRPNPNQTRLFK